MSQNYPSLVVFDLDDCTWSPETCFLSALPSKTQTGPLLDKGNGISSVKCGSDYLYCHPGALKAFQEIYEGKKYPNMKLAFCSSASTYGLASKIAFAAIEILEIQPGVTIRDALNKSWSSEIIQKDDHCLIGNGGRLSEDKATSHFPILKQNTGIEYKDMLFFDDSNWTNHCKRVSSVCGVVCQRTPHGCQINEWENGLEKWRKGRNR